MLMEEDESGVLRPRLEALRMQLQQDNEGGTSRILRLPRKRTNDSQDAKPPATLSPDLDELMRQLDALPMPQEALTDTFGRQHSYLRISL
jgi:hypothetical protein